MNARMIKQWPADGLTKRLRARRFTCTREDRQTNFPESSPIETSSGAHCADVGTLDVDPVYRYEHSLFRLM